MLFCVIVNIYVLINYIPGIDTPSKLRIGLKISWILLLISISDKVLK